LTARWAQRIADGKSTVFSGAGVWPLLGLLATGAEGATREELSAAFALAPEGAARAVHAFLDLVGGSDELGAALALWFRPEVAPYQAWLEPFPPRSVNKLTGDDAADQAELDAWARNNTRGLIKRMPCRLNPSTLLVLASAIVVETLWQKPFQERSGTVEGPWAGREIPLLTRRVGGPEVRVIEGGDGPVTITRVDGGDVDVCLLIGEPDAAASGVLAAGVAVLAEPDAGVPVSAWTGKSGAPGVVAVTETTAAFPQTHLTCTPFDIEAEHDLLKLADAFGLATASDANRARFPGISEQPLCVGGARQSAMAQFTAGGFKAAAVTAMTMATAAMMRGQPTTLTTVDYTRPFGFAAVHRASGLVLAAGWIAEPPPA
jgi:serine protease inhibitor